MRSIAAYVGLGSNLDNPAQQVQSAVEALRRDQDMAVTACSRLYRNPPMGPQDQPEYVNAVVAMTTTLAARVLLERLQAIESQLGRSRDGQRWGPRIIDLDLLVYGEAIIDEAGLHVPHRGIAERAFVLVPLAEIAPNLDIPGRGAIAALLGAIDASAVVPLAEPPTATARDVRAGRGVA